MGEKLGHRTVRTALAAAVVLCFAVSLMRALASSSAVAAPPPPTCRWTAVLELDSLVRGVDGALWAVSASSAADVWVGGKDDVRVGTETTRSRPLLAHWDGRAWKVTPSPIRWGSVEAIVHAINGAWATLRNRDGAFLLRWNGTGWRVTAPPANESSATLVYGPRGSAWLIGNYVYERQAGSWRRLSALGRVTQRDSLWTSRSSGELWRITHFGPAHTRPPLIAHWDGAGWVQAAPRLSRFTDPPSIVVFSRTEAWLAGTDGDHALLFRWDGTRWRRVPGPPRAAIDATVHTTGAHTLWLAGSTTNAAVTLFAPYLMRNQGTGWKPMPPPTSEDADNFTLYAVGKETWATTGFGDDLFRLACA